MVTLTSVFEYEVMLCTTYLQHILQTVSFPGLSIKVLPTEGSVPRREIWICIGGGRPLLCGLVAVKGDAESAEIEASAIHPTIPEGLTCNAPFFVAYGDEIHLYSLRHEDECISYDTIPLEDPCVALITNATWC